MIDYIDWVWLWARSSGTISATFRVGIPSRNVDVQTSLARVVGGGSAKAFIREYCYQHSHDQVLCAFSPDPESAPSVTTINNARSITFELQVNNMYAFATGLVFVYP